MTRADADALYAFLRTVEPVNQPNRPAEMEFPYNQRALLAFWRALYFKPGTLQSDAGQSAPWNRGRYLVEGPGHCAACHTPRNSLGATRAAEPLAGGVIPVLDWYAPPLTNDLSIGMGRWQATDIAALLKTGIAAHSTATGPMAEVVRGSTQYLSDDDALAIGVYLKTLPATPAATQRQAASASPALMDIGGKIYRQQCVQCHQAAGEGAGSAWPALAGNPGVTAPSPVNAIRMVLDGGYAPATAANPRPHGMPPFGQLLNDNDIAALVTYIRNSWGTRRAASRRWRSSARATRPRAVKSARLESGAVGRFRGSRAERQVAGSWPGPGQRREGQFAQRAHGLGLGFVPGVAAVQAQRAGERPLAEKIGPGATLMPRASAGDAAPARRCPGAAPATGRSRLAGVSCACRRETHGPPPSPSGPAGSATCRAAGAGDGRSRPVPGIPRWRPAPGRTPTAWTTA